MNKQSIINKNAWEYRAYEFWEKRDGTPMEKAKRIIEDPLGSMKKHQRYFEHVKGLKIANLCGSNGRKAVPLSLLGAHVTVFDISEENKKYAFELAKCANTSIDYIVGDINDIDVKKYTENFDVLYLEGGILHYFNNIDRLMDILFSILKRDGKMILSDYHPVGRCISADFKYNPIYFDKELYIDELVYKQFFDKAEQESFPDVLLRRYSLSEIINSVIRNGFTIEEFQEHRGWNNENIPWEFTIFGKK